MNTYKIEQLRLMLDNERDGEKGGYGAHLTHWAGGKSVQLNAGALECLIEYYQHEHDDLTF